jgi:glycosyltransferase involved in cell wall biosynthesis
MRILLISHTCQSRTEGQPKADCLARLPGVELCVLVPDRWKRYGQWRQAEPALGDQFDYEVARVRWPWLGPAQTYLHHYPRLKHLLRRFKPDVIDLWEEPWSLVSAQTCYLRDRYLPTTKIVSETEQNLDKVLPPPFEWFRGFTLRRADHLVGRSQEAVDVARRKGYDGPATVVPNAVDTDLFKPLDRALCRKQLDVDGFVVGYAGRLVEAKGIGELIEAIAQMRNPATLLLAGTGPDEPAFHELAKRLGIADRVRFVGGKPLDELPGVINAMDVLALPSRTTATWKEQFGRVIIEAHACGVPVVGSDSGAIPQVVGAGGRIVPERDPAALAVALDNLNDSPTEARRLGKLGLEHVHAHCTWQRVAERMHGIYRTLMGESVATWDQSTAHVAQAQEDLR